MNQLLVRDIASSNRLPHDSRGALTLPLFLPILVFGFVSGCSDDSTEVAHEPATESFAEFLTQAPPLRPGDIGVLGGTDVVDYDHLTERTLWEGEGQVVGYGILQVAENPGRAMAMFLASPTSLIELDEIGILARSELFEEMDGVNGVFETVPYGPGEWSYGVVAPPANPLALAFFFAADGDERALGGDYFDPPSWWDFIRGSDKADMWEAYGNRVDGLKRRTANSECFVSKRLKWDSDGEYWDSIARLECPE